MKRYISKFSVGLIALAATCLLAGCSDDTAIGQGTPDTAGFSLSIRAGVPEATATRASENPSKDTQNKNGSWMKDFTVFLFATDATDSDKPLLAKTVTVTGNPATNKQANTINLTSKELSEANITKGIHVSVYAIANEVPASPAELTKAEVMKLTGTLSEYKIASGYYTLTPMSGYIADYEIAASPDQAMTINMTRATVCLEVTLKDDEFKDADYAWTIGTIKLYNDYAACYLWKEGILANPGLRTEENAFSRDMHSERDGISGYPTVDTYALGTFYLNNNEASTANPAPTNPLIIKIEGTRENGDGSIAVPFVYTVELKRTDGSFIIPRNTKLNVTLTLKAGSVDISTETLPWDGQADDSQVVTPQVVAPKANSYILRPNTTVYIPVAQIEEARKTYTGITAIGDTEELTAELVWSDMQGTAGNPILVQVETIGTGPYALLKVKAASTECNAVVAVKGKDNTIKWSWHLWITRYDPDAAGNNHEVSDTGTGVTYTFMDRHLGAMEYVTTAANPLRLGLYYQWGRKDPFPKPQAWGGAYNAKVYDAAGSEQGITFTTVNNALPAVIKSPMTFFTASSKGGSYTTDYSVKMWGGEQGDGVYPKTVLDPCPPGWRIPSAASMTPLLGKFPTAGNPTGYLSTDVIGTKRMYFPTGGYLSSNSIIQPDHVWVVTGKIESGNQYSYLNFNIAAGSSFAGGGVGAGAYVRCVKDNLPLTTP